MSESGKLLKFQRFTSVDRMINALNEMRDGIDHMVVSFKRKDTGEVEVSWSQTELSNLTYHAAAIDIEVKREMQG